MELRIFRILLLLSLCVTYRLSGTLAEDTPCVPRTMPGGFVCVCNSTYCDTLNRPARLPQGQFHRYTTTNSTPGFSHTVGVFAADPPVLEDDVVFTVNSSVLYQEILGFGGAFTDSAGIVLQTLPPAAQDLLIRSYFSPSGIEYTFGRVPIGSTDFSVRTYTLDDVPNDTSLQFFNLSMEDYTYKIPMIKRAMAVSERPIKILACAWAFPEWMRTTTVGKYFIKETYLQTLAEYHLKFLQAYKQNGIDIWSLTGGNEVLFFLFIPIYTGSTLMTAPVQRRWFKDYLKPLLVANNFSDVKLVALEDQRLFMNYWMDRFSTYPEALEVLDGIGLHWYFDWFTPLTQLDVFHSKHPDKMLLYTETSINEAFDKYLFNLGAWDAGASYVYNALQNFDHWNQVYIDWNLCLNVDYGPTIGDPVVSAIVVNETSGEFYKQPIFYAMGHLSKFFQPGSRRMMVETNQNQTNETSTVQESKISLEDIRTHFTLSGGKASGVGGNFPIKINHTIESVIMSTGTANPDGSYAVIVYSHLNYTQHVRILDERVGTISVDIEPMSINSFVYWV